MSAYYDLFEKPDVRQTGEQQSLYARFVPKGTIDRKEFIERVHLFTGLSRSLLEGAMAGFMDELRDCLANGWTVEQQKFTFRGVDGVNIIGKRGTGPVTILGAHYDTRPVADNDPDPAKQKTPILGGNDGASGVAVLLELARAWRDTPPPGETWLTFFDLEDRGELDGWPWGVGSDYMAGHLTTTPKQMILVDMVGDSDQQIYLERTSDQPLLKRIFDVAQGLGYGQWFIPQPKHALLDDHTPFLQRRIPAVDIIDFDYPYHHTVADDCTKIAADSMERVGRTLEQFMGQGG